MKEQRMWQWKASCYIVCKHERSNIKLFSIDIEWLCVQDLQSLSPGPNEEKPSYDDSEIPNLRDTLSKLLENRLDMEWSYAVVGKFLSSRTYAIFSE